ncbi:ABC transporter permease [Nocardioides rubriscoriae]|uniref:ABC transporter permease n=1 Tax=Nocardioides rubriscoriae TaxID=642762 RepID=UPI0011E0665F|nr:ABC transporter permease [Nocardioides rubriscoriae]
MATAGTARTPAAATPRAAQAGRLSTVEAVRRMAPYWLTVSLRTWRGSVVSAFLAPVFYVVAMGVLLGGFIDSDPARLEGAPTYLAFIVPGLVAGHAMQTAVADTSWPVFSNFKWNRVYDSMVATPITVRQVAVAHLFFVWVRVTVVCAIFDLVVAPFDVYAAWWSPVAALGAQSLTGLAFATLMYGYSCRISSDAAFGVVFRLAVFPLFLFSGAFFPVANLGPVGEVVAKLTPLWHGVNLSRTCSLATLEPGTALLNVGVLLAVAGLGAWWATSGLERRMAS